MAEIVLVPPKVRITGSRSDEDRNRWLGSVAFDTPYGPVSVEACVTLPEAVRHYAAEVFHRLLAKAAASHLAWQMSQREDFAAGLFGIDIPNPVAIIASGAKSLVNEAKAAAHYALDKLPAPVKKVVSPLVNAIETTSNMTAPLLTKLVTKARKVIGSANIPGTSINIMALHPIGAAAVIGSKIIGKKATKQILDEATAIVETALSKGSAPVLGSTAATAKAVSFGTMMATSPDFAKTVGIPTASVSPNLQGAAYSLVAILRGVYNGDKVSIAQMSEIGKRASSGDTQALMLWNLAKRLTAASQGVTSAFSVGDGYGPGYGSAGYYPPAPAYLLGEWGRLRLPPFSYHGS